MTAAEPTVTSSGQYTSLVLDSAGNPVVSHLAANGDVLLTHCDDPACAPGGDVTSIQVGGASVVVGEGTMEV